MLFDLRLALRALRRSPGFAIIVVATLALGIGATVTAFSVVDGVLLRPLGYPEGDRLVLLFSSDSSGEGRTPPSYLDFEDWREQSTVFSGMAFARGITALHRGADGAELLTIAAVTDDFFSVMGVRPLLGRTFLRDEHRGGTRPMVLPHGVWTTRFGADSSIVGRTIDVGEGGATVVGVMPPGFDWPEWAQAFVPLAALTGGDRASLERRDFRVDNRVVARLSPGATLESARTELRSISRRLSDAFPETNLGWVVNPIPLRETLVGEVRAQLLVLLGAVALVLLIVCADVASLSLVRATARGHEIAVRTALGAGPLRIVRLLLAESTILALGGGVGGVLAAVWGVELFVAAAPPGLPRLDAVGVDGRVLGFALVLVLGCVLLFGAAPALYAGRGRAAEAIRESARSGRGAQGRMLRSGFVVAQIALAIVLLVGAALLIGSLAGLRRVDPGFDPDHLLTARIGGPADRYDSPEKLLALFERIAGDVAGLPGVRSAAFVNHFPMTGSGVVTPVAIPGRTADSGRDMALFRTADSDYFATAGMRIVRGRGFSAADMSPASTALVVNEALADRYWPGTDAIGRSMTVRRQVVGRPDFDAPVSGTIVGIVANTHVASLAEPADPEVFVPMPVNPWRGGYLVVRASGDPAALAGAVRRTVQAVDPDLTAARIEPAAARIAGSLARQRFGGLLLSAFAAVALLLAALGLYGVMSYAVVQRTREIGVRSALGARPREIARMFVGEGLRLALAGIAIGVALALGATRVLESMVYGVSVRDPATFLAVSAGLAAVALLASWIPARRAAKVDPVVALREQ